MSSMSLIWAYVDVFWVLDYESGVWRHYLEWHWVHPTERGMKTEPYAHMKDFLFEVGCFNGITRGGLVIPISLTFTDS